MNFKNLAVLIYITGWCWQFRDSVCWTPRGCEEVPASVACSVLVGCWCPGCLGLSVHRMCTSGVWNWWHCRWGDQFLYEEKLNVVLISSGQEDCLYLNQYAPVQAGEDPLPVMVWIYGGGFTMGSATPLQYGPQKFMDTNSVILVSDPWHDDPCWWWLSGHFQLPPEWPGLAQCGQWGGAG